MRDLRAVMEESAFRALIRADDAWVTVCAALIEDNEAIAGLGPWWREEVMSNLNEEQRSVALIDLFTGRLLNGGAEAALFDADGIYLAALEAFELLEWEECSAQLSALIQGSLGLGTMEVEQLRASPEPLAAGRRILSAISDANVFSRTQAEAMERFNTWFDDAVQTELESKFLGAIWKHRSQLIRHDDGAPAVTQLAAN